MTLHEKMKPQIFKLHHPFCIEDTEKGTASVDGTSGEFGEYPIERLGNDKDADCILELLKNEASNLKAVNEVPEAIKFID